jgi:EmrB/QacA subfamily drug resistance transporter
VTEPATTAAIGVDHANKWLVLTAIAASTILATIDASIVNVAFPTLVEELDTSFNVIQWVALGYLLTIATLTLGMGRLGDVLGKKKLYVTGLIVFTVASALCGLVPDVSWLIGFRVVQAVGSVMVLALGAAILVEAFPPTERGKALGWIGTAVSLGIVSGPVIGGLLISSFSWRAIFLVNIPVGIVGTVLAIRYIPNLVPARAQRFDVVGAVLMSVALFSLSLALTLGQDMGFTSPMIIAGFAVAVLAALAFVFVELRVDSPMLELRLFSNPALAVGVTSGYIAYLCLSATFLLLPFYLEGVLGLEVGVVGLLLGAGPLMMGLVSPFAGNLSDRVGAPRLTLFGLAVMAIVYFAFSTLGTDTTVPQYLMLAIPLGIGVGTFNSPNNSSIMGSVPPEYMGIGGGLLTITRLFGQISGIAILGSVWAASVTAYSGGSLPEAGASAAAPEAQVAGLHTTFRVAGVIMSAAVVVAVWAMRQEQRTRQRLRADG